MRSAAASALLLLALIAAGCGGSDGEASGNPPAEATTETATESMPTVEAAMAVEVYFVRDDRLAFAERGVDSTVRIATAALEELLVGPSASERKAGLVSYVPPKTEIERLAIENGTAFVELSSSLDAVAAGQVVQTLLHFETVDRVRLEGDEYLPEDMEEFLPAILVKSPLPAETVASPLTAMGTANTFEATFQAEVVQADGKRLAKRFVTATSGSGTRGTFEFRLDFVVDRQRPGKLVVYENSAEDGSVINKVEIPLVLSP